jgi:hypothetical protein
MFFVWRRAHQSNMKHSWILYGWFSALICIGSLFGAMTWLAWMHYIVALFKGTDAAITGGEAGFVQAMELNAEGQQALAVFFISYAFEFLCLTVAKMLMLIRLTEFVSSPFKHDSIAVSKWIFTILRSSILFVVLGNLAGLGASFSASGYAVHSADLFSATAKAAATNSSNTLNCAGDFGCTALPGFTVFESAFQQASAAHHSASVQQFCEVTALVVIILAFTFAGAASAHTFKSALKLTVDASASAAGLQALQRIIGTTTFVFISFLLRASFSIMNSTSNALQNNGAPTCDDAIQCDPRCFNMWQLMQEWLQFTPEFQLSVVLVSSPLTLLVALWGMTNRRMVQHFLSSSRPVFLANPRVDEVTLPTKLDATALVTAPSSPSKR